MQREDSVTFVCPECGGEAAVTTRTRRTLLEAGCVFCGAPVPACAFVIA